MTRQICFRVSTAVAVALWLSAAEAQVTVIKAGQLVDPETGTTQYPGVEDGRHLRKGSHLR